MAGQTVKVNITTDASGAISGVNQFESRLKGLESSSQSMVANIKQHWLGLSAAVYAAYGTVNKAIQLMDEGARAMQQKSSFKIMAEEAGVSADKMIASMKKATKGTVDDSDLMQKATKLMLAGYDPKQIQDFSKVAITASQYMGVNVSESFERISDALATRMPRALVQAGAATREQMKIVQKAMEAGATQADLLALAIANLRVKQLQLQGTQDGATLAMQRYHAQLKDTRETIGELISVGLQKLYAMWQSIGSASLSVSSGIYKILEARNKLAAYLHSGDEARAYTAAAAEFKAMADADTKAAAALDKQYRINMGLEKPAAVPKASKDSIDTAQSDVAARMAKLNAMVANKKATEDSAKEAEAALKRMTEATRKAAYEIDSVGLSQYQKDLDRIHAEAAEYLKITKNKGAVAKFVAAETELALRKSFIVQTEDAKKMYDEMQKGAEDYRKMFSEEQSFAVSTHEKAMLQIVANENNKLLAAEKLMDTGKISWDQYQAYMVLVAQNTALATADLKNKELNDSLALLEQLGAGYQTEYERLFELTVISEADILEVKMKALGIYFDKAKWINDQLIKHGTTEFQKNISSISNAFSGLGSTFSQMAANYEKGSDAEKRWTEAAKVMEIAQRSLAVVNAVAAVAASATAPFPAGFVSMAAMAASMVALLATIGEGLGGGSASAAAPALSKSTVLGAADGTGSESIANSYKMLQDIYNIEDTKLTDIYNEMRDLNNNITGLVTSIVRTGGISTEGMNLDLSYIKGAARNIWEGGFANVFSGMLEKLPLVSWLNNLLGSWGESIFGGGTSSEITAQGISIGNTIVKNILNGATISAQQYANVTTTTSGGWFGSDSTSTSTQYAALNKDVISMLTLVFKNIGSTLVTLSQELGTDTNAALNYVFNATQINLQGKTTDEMNKALQEYISNISDTAVEALFGAMLESYQKLNEGLMETAVRLVTDKAVVEQILTTTGQSFSGTTSEAIALSESLISLAGDLKTLQEAASTYYDKFTVDTQKQTDLQKSLSDAMNYYNLSLADLRDGYNSIVEGLDLTTESGKAAYIALLSMSDSADKYYTYIENLAKQQRSLEIQLMEAQGDAAGVLAAKRADELAAMDATLRPLQQMIWLTQDWAAKLNDATTATTSAVDAQISLSKSAASTARSNADAYRQIIDSLTSEQTKIRGGGIAGAQNRLNTVFSTAMTGDQAALKALPQAIDDMLAESLRTSKTAEDYARAQGKALIQLEQAKTASAAMVNWEEYQATLLETQTGLLEEIKAELEKTYPSLDILTRQATMLGTIADILQTQTTQVIAGNTYTIDQTGSIVTGNALTSAQTDQVITGNATQDAIKNITNLNTAYSQEMLNALISGEGTQTNSLAGILTANNLTVSLIRQLVTLTTNSQMEKAAAAIQSAASALVPLSASLTAAIALQTSTAATLKTAQATANAPDKTLAQVIAANSSNAYSNAVAASGSPDLFSRNTNKLTKEQLLTNLYNAGTGAVITQKDMTKESTSYNDQWDYYTNYYLDVKGMLQSQAAGSKYYDINGGPLVTGPIPGDILATSAPITASLIAGKAAQEAAESAAVSAAYSAATTASQQAAEANAKLATAQASLNALVAQYTTTYGTTPSFAYGGISTGSESGYEATLHGTELIISPKTSFPATVTGGDNVILIDEIRKLRAEAKEQNARLARMEKTNKTTADVLQRVTRDGESMLTEAI